MEIIISVLWVIGITAAMLGILSGVKALCKKMVREACEKEKTSEGE